jgi:hypothetical protein
MTKTDKFTHLEYKCNKIFYIIIYYTIIYELYKYH